VHHFSLSGAFAVPFESRRMKDALVVKKCILIIDDEEDFIFLAESILKNHGGFHVVTALGGEEGVRAAARERPDLILLDVVMAGLDGPATFERLKKIPSCRETPIVFVTGVTGEVERSLLLDLGAAEVLKKPVDVKTFSDRIFALLPGS
jgi:DNA-binding response OmpR family regulator